jgi:hypothetical protein
MGHERLGILPKTQRWQQVIDQIAKPSLSDEEVSSVARQTAHNISSRLRNIQTEPGVRIAFKFLVSLSVASRSPKPREALSSHGIEVPVAITPLSVAKAVRAQVAGKGDSLEYGEIAQNAAIDAIALWYEDNRDRQMSLFEPSADSFQVWRKTGNGAGFCELARLFFAKFTERYLNYFLEREASARLGNLYERDQFQKKMRDYVDIVSKHAFETAKITQSFAAGWFNKHAAQDIPTDGEIQDFLFVAFGKIREELQREG